MKRKKLSQKKRREIVESVVGKVPWEKFEAGIYNYCDRWCERCDNTTKCYLFYEKEQDDKKLIKMGKYPNDFKSSMEIIGKNLSQTHELIMKISEAEGIDLTITEEDEKKYEEQERKTDHSSDPLYIKSKKLFMEINNWLKTTPPLDFDDYQDEYEKLNWHHSLFSVKIARSISGKKEAEIEKGFSRECDINDSKKSGWVAYRSAKICLNALEYMDQFVRDSRIRPMIEKCKLIISEIDKKLL